METGWLRRCHLSYILSSEMLSLGMSQQSPGKPIFSSSAHTVSSKCSVQLDAVMWPGCFPLVGGFLRLLVAHFTRLLVAQHQPIRFAWMVYMHQKPKWDVCILTELISRVPATHGCTWQCLAFGPSVRVVPYIPRMHPIFVVRQDSE